MNAPLVPPPVPAPDAQTTPVMAQFLAAKAAQPDAILFFRMGDFYELFFKDAEVAAACAVDSAVPAVDAVDAEEFCSAVIAVSA